MGYKIIREPYLLYETVEMLYKYVNGTSYRSLLCNQLNADHTSEDNRVVRHVEQLQQIMELTCRGLDRNDPMLRRFFSRVDTGSNQEGTCLAFFLTMSFINLDYADLRRNIAQTCAEWHCLREKGAWIQGWCIKGLLFCQDTEAPGDLLMQVSALELPPEFRISLYDALSRFDDTMQTLLALIEPVAADLAKNIRLADWIVDEWMTNWNSQSQEPRTFFSRVLNGQTQVDTDGPSVMAISVMNYNFVLERESELTPRSSYLYIGCGTSMEHRYEKQSVSYETLSLALKALSDKKRLEVLARLSQKKAYGQELAEAMDIAPSNMSRNLALLHSYGFLKQHKEAQKIYYEADRDVIRHFLNQLERTLLH